MKKVPNWYVITGGPNSGKTTIINYFTGLGYYTVPEYARMLIEKEKKNGNDVRRHEFKFQHQVLKGKLKLEKKAPKNKTVFFDRGIPDSIAYFHFLKMGVPMGLKFESKDRYKKVFILDMLPYRKDSARVESKKEAKEIHAWIKKIYKNLGYKIIRVRVMPIEDRVKFILKYVK
ncbi:MAG: ATP-binding protein [Candidatus Aenigmarchaeota archaeon]|nr:ATP-binding protein [Candidatus Aenigmarchaeota archaeon]